jgi:hypothetical protein
MQILIVTLLVIIIILLVAIFLHNYRPSSITIPSNTRANTNLAYSEQPVILDSPYYYDSGYWFNPDWWWRGYDYVTNNYYYQNHNRNHNHNHRDGDSHHDIRPRPTNSPMPTTSLTTPSPIPTGNESNPIIQSLLPTGQLIAPSQNSVFPLPTLVSSLAPIPIPSIASPVQLQSSIEMQNQRLPALINPVNPEVIPDNMAARIDQQASQVIGMRGGNSHLDPVADELTPKIK